jgi:glycosyltransferase involved in cell wall biosynthesis
MIYLDVTSACQSPLQTGVRRVQRGLHEFLRTREDYLPICWQSAWQSYRTLRPGDFRNLERPRSSRGPRLHDLFAPGMFSDWLRTVGDSLRLLDFFQEARPVDTLLLSDLLWDNRPAVIHRLWVTGLHRVAIFHDAIALRQKQSRIDRFLCERGIRALAEMDAVVCVSEEAEQDLLRYWGKFRLRPAATFVVPWPMPFTGPRPMTFPNFPARNLLYVARIEPHKNHLRLLQACDKLWWQGLHFSLRLIGGKGSLGHAWRIGAQVRWMHGRGRQVTWDQNVSDDQLHAAYRDSSFTVFPSLQEGFGLPIVESLWHGRPVLCSDEGAIGELAAGGGCAPVDTLSVDSLAEEIRRLLTDQLHYEKLFLEAEFRSYQDWAGYWRNFERKVK